MAPRAHDRKLLASNVLRRLHGVSEYPTMCFQLSGAAIKITCHHCVSATHKNAMILLVSNATRDHTLSRDQLEHRLNVIERLVPYRVSE